MAKQGRSFGYTTPAVGLSFGLLINSAGSANKKVVRSLDGTVVLATPGSDPVELWMSMLVSFRSAVLNADISIPGDRLKLTIPDTGSMVLTGHGNAFVTATGPFATDTAHLVIMRAIAIPGTRTGESASLWINSADFSSVATLGAPSAQTATPNYLDSGIALTSLTIVNVRAEDEGNAWFIVDEILIGTTLADVTPAATPVPLGTLVIIK